MNRLIIVLTLVCISVLITSFALAGEPNALFREKKCDSCHGFNLSSDRNLAPNLRYAGEKFQSEWLEKYLNAPEPIRLMGYSTAPGFLKGKAPKSHPAVSSEEAKVLSEFLMTLRSVKENNPVDSQPLSKGQKARVKIKFERDYGCTACHQAINLAHKPRGGLSGPSLVDAGNRLDPGWIYRWLTNPKAYKIKTRMPIFQMTKEDTIGLVKYIMTLKKENLR